MYNTNNWVVLGTNSTPHVYFYARTFIITNIKAFIFRVVVKQNLTTMHDPKLDSLSKIDIYKQIIFICGFFFTVFLLRIIWERIRKPSNPQSDQRENNLSSSSITSPISLEKDKKETHILNENRATLTKFINDNEKLINVLGVFTAITVFVSELRLQAYGYGLSFLFMTLTVILWLELWGKFPSERGDWKIFWFENILFLTVLALIAYWLIDFRDIWHAFLFVLIFGLISSVFSTVMKRFGVFNKLFHTQPGKRKWLRYTFGIIVFLIIITASLLLSQFIAPFGNSLLDLVNELFKNSPP